MAEDAVWSFCSGMFFQLFIDAQDFAGAPGLGVAAFASFGLRSVIDFREKADTAFSKSTFKACKLPPDACYGAGRIVMHLEEGPEIGAQREGPDGALVVGHVTVPLVSCILPLIFGIQRGQ